ncbi:MerR family transcriptional regulator [Candidatus Babeliales bacterium]|nr:MerR family transcriptional regulator [Candidatus Babeliales bacterium]
MKKKKGFYSISVVAEMFSVHQQTIRMYEKEGLLTPKRSSGNTRLFAEEDIERLEEIINLTHKMGVNLAGVEIILKLQKKIKKLQGNVNKLFDEAQGQIEEQTIVYKNDAKQQAQRLLDIKQENLRLTERQQSIDIVEPIEKSVEDKNKKNAKIDDWEIDYDQD